MGWIKSRRGASNLLTTPIVLMVFCILIVGSVVMLGEMSKIADLRRMSQNIAREIALTGKVDDVVARKLQELEQSMGLDVEMVVEGSYMGNTNRLKLESDFTVKLYYHSRYGVGVINFKGDSMYVGVANGTVEEYHKMP